MKNLWLFDETRIAILAKLLGCGAAPGCDLRECLKIKKSLLSHHLKMLRENGVIVEAREGREKYYRIRRSKVALARKVVAAAG